MSASADYRSNSLGLLRDLRLRDATAIVAGTIIGSGIFLVPGNIANDLSSFSAVLLVWLTGGLLSLFGALALGEMGAAFPGAGGLYVYLRQAYGRTVGFLYGWALLALIHSGSIATLAVAFRIYVAQILPLSATRQKFAGILCVLVLTGVNCLGVRSGKSVHNLLTVAKYTGIAIMLGLLFYGGHFHLLRASVWPKSGFSFRPAFFGVALIAVLWAYEGWHVLSFVSGEFKNPQRDLPRGLFYGTLIVTVTYLLANVAYYSVLSNAQLRHTQRAAATAVSAATGGGSAIFISVLILVSIVGATNGMILTGPRVYYAMAEEGLFFPIFGKVSARFRAPVFAILVQGLWAAGLTLLGTFQELFTYVVFTGWIFYGLAVAGVIVLRIRQPDLERPFRAPGYPWLPALFTLAALGITVSAVVSSPIHAAFGVGLVLTGLPLYALFVVRIKSKPANSSAGAAAE
ncbi:MAG: amino acid permease [Candidatus Acidiferrales bacterium]